LAIDMMMERPVDLRSDFVSRPTLEMIKAMVQAAYRPCSFGLREDPIQKRLEALTAEVLEKEDALFFPTCTMCNQAAIHIFCRPGQSFVAEAKSHILAFETSSPAVLSGAAALPVPGKKGRMSIKEVRNALENDDGHRATPGLVILENSHLCSGGRVLPLKHMAQIESLAKEWGIPVHLDGSRLFNAAIRLETVPGRIARHAESVAVSLNKGLSAPMGAVLAGTKKFIQEALRVRQIFGGGWRPTHIMAAAGIVALENMIGRLAEDHENAEKIARGIMDCPGIILDPQTVETNIVLVRLVGSASKVKDVIRKLAKRGILVHHFGKNVLRMVTHREIGPAEVKFVVSNFRKILL
jgi:threonine aldolase